MMMTNDELEYLCTQKALCDIKANLERDVLKVAMDKSVERAGLIASEIKYLQKARTKLPSYYEALCIIPSIGFEQCSSEQTSETKQVGGDLCIDLTCGLGVDTLRFSKQFNRVIALERDPMMAQIARVNFARMGVRNVEVICSSAEEFIASCSLKADLIYADPDRRGEKGKKQVVLEDCSPNMLELDQKLRQISRRIMIKCSPLFDVEQAFRLFGAEACVEVVSLGGECKEVVIEYGENVKESRLKVNAIGIDNEVFSYCLKTETKPCSDAEQLDIQSIKYVILPDVALQKSRCAVSFYSAQKGAYIETNNSCVLCESEPERPFGKVFRVERMEKFNPKALKKEFKARGIKKIEIIKRNFDLSAEQIISQLGVKHGGLNKVIFTKLGGLRCVIFVE